ncbi:ribulose-phosphate 3-epimerase [Desulfomonile tiedjei]|uniref:Ribulose-phosphate 3-epimerase n=1 Tax=Desulfomonile tiedjei (strain ATCC 49306 / DSM 6799 / DCB-1) TaxID=706587 RepID=I4CA66_DESTA|nr:ribulose-phosphate 3-epimerase [Desulfomonile tiedjei]AFM26457.1 ribulose-5-phosphate 3-epimerase [Desulfomonile tiedjei DSM 6799]
MNRRILVSPSILSADFSKLGDEIKAVEQAGADFLHIDVMDGHFVPNITIGPMIVEACKKIATIPLDVHLMIAEPDRYLEDFHAAGANILTVHPEATHHLHRTLTRIRELGMQAGAALNPSTGLEAVRYVLAELDILMIMTVNPGFGGQSFIPTMLEKVRSAREMADKSGYPIRIEVDGGVAPSTAPDLICAGADIFVAGSAVFLRPPYSDAINLLRSAETQCRTGE